MCQSLQPIASVAPKLKGSTAFTWLGQGLWQQIARSAITDPENTGATYAMLCAELYLFLPEFTVSPFSMFSPDEFSPTEG